MKKKLLLSAMALAMASSVAADEVGRWYVTPQVGALITDNDRTADNDDRLFGLSIGKHLSER